MKTAILTALSLLVLLAMACQPDRELDSRITYTGRYDVLTQTMIQRQVTGKIDTLAGSDIIEVSLGHGPNELMLNLPINISLTATLTGSSFTIPAQAVIIANAEGRLVKANFRSV